jgi:hypothetical protein
MARIKTYPLDTLVTDKDIIIGTDADNFNETKNFKVETLRDYMLSGLEPEVGGNLKITTITATDEINLTPEDYFNNLQDPLVVLNYEIIFLILNGRTYIFRRNGNTFGIGETQTSSSDFTEIDITSIINANLQDLDSVLTTGNESDLDAIIMSLFLKNTDIPSGGNSIELSGFKNRLNVHNNQGLLISSIEKNGVVFHNAGTSSMSLLVPNVTGAGKIATFQNASGTVAYLSDIPNVPVTDLIAGNNVTITESPSGVFTIDSTQSDEVIVLNTLLRNSNTNTTYFQKGGLFTYDAITSPIDTVEIQKSEVVIADISQPKIGYIHFHYINGDNKIFELNTSTNTSVDGSVLKSTVPFSEYFFKDDSQLSFIDICIYPNVLKSSSNVFFNGCIPTSLSRYVVEF